MPHLSLLQAISADSVFWFIGFTVVACVIAVASVPAVDSVLTIATIPAVASIPAVAGVPALADVPSVDGVLAVVCLPILRPYFVSAGIFTY